MNTSNFEQINLPDVSIDSLLWNLFICIILSGIISIHFNFRAKKIFCAGFRLVLPIISLTTLLVISVVKSSLALSLGLVGALSIVRFRTPVKEPEELAYIFLAIAIGLSLGADQREVALIALPIILLTISVADRLKKGRNQANGNLMLNVEIRDDDAKLDNILDLLEEIIPDLNIQRIDHENNFISIIADIKIADSKV